MAYILARRQSDGSTRYTAVIRLRKGKAVIHREAKTFTHRSAAEKWAKSREVALEQPGAIAAAQYGETSLRELIRWYINTFETVSKWQRTKQAQLEYLERHSISASNALTLTPAELINHVRSRRTGGAGAATVGNDLIWIGVVLRAAKSVRGIPVRPEVVLEARTACRELRLIAKSRRRDRRPTFDELAKLDTYFERRDRRSQIPMRDVFWFAIHSARREAEICRLDRRDNNQKARTGLLRDAKHPTAKEGNHKPFKFTPEAWALVETQPKTGDFIFPYNPKSIGSAFTRACHVLGIEDLRFHDLRHEATSRLFERGYQIHEVAQFTLHESWNELKRYANLRPERVREIPEQPATNKRARKSRSDKDDLTINHFSRAGDRSIPQDRSHSRAKEISARPT